jgi:N-acetylmuramoyl-L-alanine amidase
MIRIALGTVAFFLLIGCGGPTTNRSDSLVVIDAGHGGKDPGARCGGRQEKDAVLQIVKRLKDAFKDAGYRVYLTRGNDRFLTLGERTRIADKLDAKVFISIHANAIANRSHFETTEGIETYFLQKTRDARSQRIAKRENDAVLQGADELSKNVIIDSVLNGPKIIESNKLAIDVQKNIMHDVKSAYSDAKNGGVKPAPFYVLVGASRPSILVEVGYITNTKERERLFTSKYQEKIAEGIVKGTSRYLDNRKREMGF